MSNQQHHEKTIFNAALQLPDGEARTAYLKEACGDDLPLRMRVDALLQDHPEVGSFMENPPTAVVPVTEQSSDRIGRYKLLEKIGEGGMGIVWMAEQTEPVRRRVALKVIKLGMDTKQVVARFEAERQALAMMDHPNIAKVLDAGATDTGRPFFVMELVRGIKITDYCDQNNLSTKERLELFMQVCQAIQHAHQKGIIHRDIKPSNILVTLHDDVAVPKVIDFGIAKATVGQLTDKTVFTAFAQFIGTPAYMSPEQAQMSGLDIDTRADIYSLGVLLYELLTGNTPFDAKDLLAAGLDEMRRKIREDEPARPSTRLSTMLATDLTTVARRRHVEPPKLVHLIRGDLDWLVMKCLEKDRTRRYETANGLAMDLKRHLNYEPIVARPPSNFYRFQKMVRRNKLAFAAAGAVVAALVIGFSVSLWQFIETSKAHRRAERAIAKVEKLGGKVELDDKRPDKPVIKVDLRRTKVTDADLEILKAFTQVRSLNLGSSLGVTDAGMKHLKGLTALERLDLDHTRVGDAGLEHLKGLTKLNELSLADTPVTDAGIKHLKGLTDLRSLNLCLCATVTDAGVGHLAGLTKIQALDLNSVQVTDAGLKHLHDFTELEWMNVGDTKVTEAGVKELSRVLPNAKISR